MKLELEMMGESSVPPEKLYTLPPKDVAEGLTGMDAELLERISPEEFCDGAWMKRDEKVREGRREGVREGGREGRRGEGGRERGREGGRETGQVSIRRQDVPSRQ